MYRIVELTNGLKFVELAKIGYDSNQFLFVASLTEDIKFLFLQKGESDSDVIPVEDGELILQLTERVQEEVFPRIKEQLKSLNLK